MVRHHMFHLTQ